MIKEKIKYVNPHMLPRLCEMLNIKTLGDLSKEKFNVNPKHLYELYLVYGISPHETQGGVHPPYKIRLDTGLDKRTARAYCRGTTKNLLKLNQNYTVNQIIKILDDCEGLIALKFLLPIETRKYKKFIMEAPMT